jgi:hypothetical protein
VDEKSTTVSTAVVAADPGRAEATRQPPAIDAPMTAPSVSIPTPAATTVHPATPRKAMARKKVSTTVYIEPEQAEKLRLLHERTKVPIAVYIREGIELALAKYEHLLPGQLSLDPTATPRKG